MSDTFADVRAEMEEIGIVYRAIQQTYSHSISVTYMDPRNHFSIAGYLFRQWKNGSLRFSEIARSLFKGVRRGAFFYNGHWLNPDQTLDEKEIIQRIKAIREKGEG